MKKSITLSFYFLICITLCAQPENFTWNQPFTGKDFISNAKDQIVQGPCSPFATTAALEAAIQIFFNKTLPLNAIDLSEQQLYSDCVPNFAVSIAPIKGCFDFIVSEGIVEETCFPYPEESGQEPDYYFGDCDNIGECTENASIPGYDIDTNITSITYLERLIIDKGPIAAYLPYIGNYFYGGEHQISHTLLIIGWETENGIHKWIFKDSWPDSARIWSSSFDILNYECSLDKYYYSVKYEVENDTISCNQFGKNDRLYEDSDNDGFYYWGIGSKPEGCPGPCKMDFDDNDQFHICLYTNYLELPTPYVTGPDLVCQSGGTFEFDSLPSGFSTPEWEVSPSVYFNSPISGTGDSIFVTPKSQYIGKECTFTFTISDACGSAEYSKDFVINGPEEDLISIEVEDAYGGTPDKYGNIWLLCPYTTYYIYVYNNSDCSTSGYDWNLPSGWTEYYSYNNYVSINTGSNPSGTMEVLAYTCCGGSRVKIKTQYFSTGYNCGGYYSVYPNPASTEFIIKFSDKFDLETEDASLEIYDRFFNIKYILKRFMKENTIYTNDWKDGLYYIRLKYNGIYYYDLLKIVH